jgi:5-methylcytosine-specific restriction endonuclease McrA
MGMPKKERAACPACGRPVENLRSKYCSRPCMSEVQYRDYIRRWLAGEIHGGRGEGAVSRHIRRWLFARSGGKCELCGWSRVHPVTGLVPLTVNHKDGNSENHRPENLELLCGGCHTLTPNYGKLNKGRGRRRRREILQQKALGM